MMEHVEILVHQELKEIWQVGDVLIFQFQMYLHQDVLSLKSSQVLNLQDSIVKDAHHTQEQWTEMNTVVKTHVVDTMFCLLKEDVVDVQMDHHLIQLKELVLQQV